MSLKINVIGAMKEEYKIKYEPHSPTLFGKRMRLPWQYCRVCGLVYLNNEETRKAIRKGHEIWE